MRNKPSRQKQSRRQRRRDQVQAEEAAALEAERAGVERAAAEAELYEIVEAIANTPLYRAGPSTPPVVRPGGGPAMRGRAGADPAAAPSTGGHRVTVMNPKGGVGKTLTAAAIGYHLSELRGETVSIIDANQHTGTLRRRLVRPDAHPVYSIVDLADQVKIGAAAAEWPWLLSFHDRVGRLRVFSNASEDPGRVEAMPGADYARVVELISRASEIVVQDMGTSITGEVAQVALAATDTLVLATDLTQDTLELTIELVAALAGAPQLVAQADGWSESTDYSTISDGRYADLATSAVIVVGPSRDEDRDPADVAPLLEWLAESCGAVVMVGRDQHLATGDLIDFEQVTDEVHRAHLVATGHVATRFASPPRSTAGFAALARELCPVDSLSKPAATAAAPAAAKAGVVDPITLLEQQFHADPVPVGPTAVPTVAAEVADPEHLAEDELQDLVAELGEDDGWSWAPPWETQTPGAPSSGVGEQPGAAE